MVTTPLVKCLCESGYTVDLLLTKSSSVVMEHNPYVRNIYEAEDCNNEVFLKRFTHTVAKSTVEKLRGITMTLWSIFACLILRYIG